MQRRRFLALAAATGGLATAGCTTSGAPDEDPNEHATPISNPGTSTPEETPTPDTPTPDPDPAASIDGLASATIRTTETDCLSEDAGNVDVDFDHEETRVRLVGDLQARDQCREAVFADVALDEPDDDRSRLSVDVSTRVPEDEGERMCAQCVGVVHYEATLVFSAELPGTASVSHDGTGVATAGWDRSSESVGGEPDEKD